MEVHINTPAPVFPLNLAGEVRVRTLDFDGAYSWEQLEFGLSLPLTVARVTATGYEPVPYSLEERADLLPNMRAIVLDDPQPGRYVVASEEHTCDGDPSPTGVGALIGEYEMTAELPVPTTLGAASWLGQSSVSAAIGVGIDGACEEITADALVARNTFTLDVAADVEPWMNVLSIVPLVDGEPHYGVTGSAALSGGTTFELDEICSSEDPSLSQTLADGPHELRFVARTADPSLTFESTSVAFELRCADVGDPATEATDGAGGCSTVGFRRATHRPLFGLLAGLTLLWWRRRRRGC
jgi:hypothetical protein